MSQVSESIPIKRGLHHEFIFEAKDFVQEGEEGLGPMKKGYMLYFACFLKHSV